MRGFFLIIAAAPGTEQDPLAGLRDIAPPVEVPWPAWAGWALGAGMVAAAVLLVWLWRVIAGRRPAAAVLTPRQVALREIEVLRGRAAGVEAYEFSIAVSDVLRRYVSGHYGLRATEQTSPEFLASIAESPRFGEADRRLLGAFLERCDLLKFARVAAGAGENEELLREAAAFVQGGREE